jgi:hypothetical protein
MLDVNMLLFSTSDFIYRHCGAAADAGDHQRRYRYLAWLDHRPVRHRAGGDDAGGLADERGHSADPAVGLLCGLVNAALIHYTGISPLVITLGTLYLYGGALLLSGMAGRRVMKASAVSRIALPPSPISLCWACPYRWCCLRYHPVFLADYPPGALWPPSLLLGQNPRAARYAALSVNGMPYALYGLVGWPRPLPPW